MRLTRSLFSKVGELTKKYSNLPESYIKRSMEQVYWRTPKGQQYQKREVKRKKFRFDVDRPWTAQFQSDNQPGVLHKKIFVEPILNWSFFKGDRVEILVGPDKGKQGIISQVIQERNWVIVEGLNCKLKVFGENSEFPGIYIRAEQPLLVTNEVALVDPADLKAGPIEWRYTEAGEKVRVSVRTGRIIPIPKAAEETYDYKTKATYKEADKDTKEDDVIEITFEPALKTFEMDIMDNMGIKEDRVPGKTYWY
ncbi:large ribosomal subunit protein uL24m [Periplaneta americana]|uniref:large ribosomal subunit protein uL24m n=1 Tax=Periplaneta americana TaxID=6978 RepID=UPI0037E9703F